MNEPKEIKTKPEKVPTATQTFTLIQEGRSIEDIAQHRWLTVGTIIWHIEKLLPLHPDLQIDLPLPREEALLEIIETIDEIQDSKSKDAIDETGKVKLGALYAALRGQYDYEVLRVVRLYIQMETVEV